MSPTTQSGTLLREILALSQQLEDYDPSGAFSLREEAGFFTEIPFRLPVYLKSGRVSLIEALKVSHGPPRGKFLLATRAAPGHSTDDMRRACLERTLKACLHNLEWRGAEIHVRCDPRELSPDVRASVGTALAAESARHPTEPSIEFLLPWRRLPSLTPTEETPPDADVPDEAVALAAARRLGITSLLDLYELSVLNIFPTACASHGIRMDACIALIKGRGSWAFRVADSIHAAYGSPVRVELAGRRYRPAPSRSAPACAQRGPQQQGRWEMDDRSSGANPEVLILLGGTEPIGADDASRIRSCLVFHVHRQSLTPGGETGLRNKGIVVVPHLLLCSLDVLVADSLAQPDLCRRIVDSSQEELAEEERRLRAGWRHSLLATWNQILAETRDEQCTAHEAAIRLSASRLLQFIRRRLDSLSGEPPPGVEPDAAQGLGDRPQPGRGPVS